MMRPFASMMGRGALGAGGEHGCKKEQEEYPQSVPFDDMKAERNELCQRAALFAAVLAAGVFNFRCVRAVRRWEGGHVEGGAYGGAIGYVGLESRRAWDVTIVPNGGVAAVAALGVAMVVALGDILQLDLAFDALGWRGGAKGRGIAVINVVEVVRGAIVHVGVRIFYVVICFGFAHDGLAEQRCKVESRRRERVGGEWPEWGKDRAATRLARVSESCGAEGSSSAPFVRVESTASTSSPENESDFNTH
jgi:hypothetical protein